MDSREQKRRSLAPQNKSKIFFEGFEHLKGKQFSIFHNILVVLLVFLLILTVPSKYGPFLRFCCVVCESKIDETAELTYHYLTHSLLELAQALTALQVPEVLQTSMPEIFRFFVRNHIRLIWISSFYWIVNYELLSYLKV